MSSSTESKPSHSAFSDNVAQADNEDASSPPPYTPGEGANNNDNEKKATADQEKNPVDLPIRGGPEGASGRAGRGGTGSRGGMHGAARGGPHAGRGRGRGRGRGLGPGRGRGRGMGHHAHMASHHRKGSGSHAPGFGLPALIGNLGSRLGLNFNGSSNSGDETEQKRGPNGFVPRADVFDMPPRYIVHVSLPGAKKQNINVDYQPALSVLHISGTVNRPPGIQKKQMDGLVVDGRKNEIGPFEKIIHLGTRLNPANIAVKKITSKLEDGVLFVFLPKKAVDPGVLKKRISIEEQNKGEKGKVKDNANDDKKADGQVLYEYKEKSVDDGSDTGTEDNLLLEEDYARSDSDEKEYVTVDVK